MRATRLAMLTSNVLCQMCCHVAVACASHLNNRLVSLQTNGLLDALRQGHAPVLPSTRSLIRPPRCHDGAAYASMSVHKVPNCLYEHDVEPQKCVIPRSVCPSCSTVSADREEVQSRASR